MKKISLVTILLLSLLSLANGKGIEFETGDFKSVLAKAAKENKLVFIDVYTSWCGPCKMMSKEVFTLENVGNFYNKNFICYKIDAEKGEGPQIREKYNVLCYPTFLYVAPDGTLKHRFSSSCTPEEFIGKGKTALDNKRNLTALKQQYESGKLPAVSLPAYIALLKDAYLDYQTVSNDYFASIPEKDLLNPQYTQIIKDYMTSMDNPHFKYLVKNWSKFEPLLTIDFMDNVIFKSISNALTQKDYVAYNRYIEQLKTIDYIYRDYFLAWAEKQYYETGEDWDRFVESGVKFINKHASDDWVTIWRFGTEFLRDEVFIGKHKAIGIEIVKRATELMPNYSTWTTYARILYKTGELKYKEQIIDLYKKAIQYEIDNQTGRDVTEEKQYLEEIRKMEYNCHALSPYIITVQPIVARGENSKDPASMAIPKDLISKAYEKAEIQFYFLEPIYWDNTNVRDGLIDLDSVCRQAAKENVFKGIGDIVNMVFVNKAIGRKGPSGFGKMNGNVTFVALGDKGDTKEQKDMQAFVIAHEIGHNLGLQHIVDDKNIPANVPNIMGEGAFYDRIDPAYSLTSYQIGVIRKSPLIGYRVDILSEARGEKALFDETFEPWISNMQQREITAFTGKSCEGQSLEESREMLRDEFKNAVSSFTYQEQRILRRIMNKVINTLSYNGLSLMAEHPWRFIKTSSDICGGFAYTVGNCIVLSDKHTKFMTDNEANDKLLMERIGKLIVHEQTHVLQRTFPEKFRQLYCEEWNFTKATVGSTPEMTLNQVSNPDAPTAQWLIADSKGKGRYYWPRVMFNEKVAMPQMGKDFVEYAYVVKFHKNKYQLVTKKGQPEKILLSELDSYTKSFGVTTGIDHPNEISAYLMSDYFMDLVHGKKSDLTLETTQKFVTWVTKAW